MSVRETWNTIDNFFGAYFHEDWADEAESPDGVLQIYLRGHNTREIRDLVEDIEQYLKDHPDDAELEWLLHRDLGCNYNTHADGLTARQWMTHVAEILRQEADRRSMAQA